MDQSESRWMKWLFIVVAILVVLNWFGALPNLSNFFQARPTTNTTHQIATGTSVRQLVGFYTVRSDHLWRRSREIRYAAHRLEFTSSGGSVDVCVVPCRMDYRADSAAHRDEMTAQFAAGGMPEEAVAQVSGTRGRLDFEDPLERGNLAQYAVLVRSQNATEVNIVVDYWRF